MPSQKIVTNYETSSCSEELYQLPVKDIEGNIVNLMPYQGQVLLIVNVASQCGFTPQYAKLEAMYRDYIEQNFNILGFPCNQFLHQEPGNEIEIKNFVESCYKVSFPIFAKIDVKGVNQSPLYAYLAKHIQKKPFKFVPWNFTKILVDSSGTVLKQFLPIMSFEKIRKEIDLICNFR